MASGNAVKVTEGKGIDPALLFHRFLVVPQSGQVSLDEIMDYMNCHHTHPPYLRHKTWCTRQIRHNSKMPWETISLPIQMVKACLPEWLKWNTTFWMEVLFCIGWSGLKGALLIQLHHLQWIPIGKATIVFHGYRGRPTTKDNTQKRRKRNQYGNRVNITDTTIFSGNKEDFLANDANKQDLIQLISRHMRANVCHVIEAEG